MFKLLGSLLRSEARKRPEPSTLRNALRDTMARASSWDGRRLRRRMLDDFGRFGMDDAYVSSLNPMGGYLRVSRAGDARQAVIIRYVEPREARGLGTDPGWVAVWDNFAAECWSLDEERSPHAIADMVADFVGAV
jgi:hypothetical protein